MNLHVCVHAHKVKIFTVLLDADKWQNCVGEVLPAKFAAKFLNM